MEKLSKEQMDERIVELNNQLEEIRYQLNSISVSKSCEIDEVLEPLEILIGHLSSYKLYDFILKTN